MGQDEKLRHISRLYRKLAREIEKLAPAVDRDASPQNAEYPWRNVNQIIVPCEYDYPNLTLLKEPGGPEFLKLIRTSIMDFDTIRIS